MENSRNEFFCGGLFFCLILEAAKQQRSKGDAMQNGSDGITEPNIMNELINVVCPGHIILNSESFEKNTSEYKTCKYKGGKHIPFNNTVTLQLFDTKVRESYQTVLGQMMDFVNSFLDREMMEWLVKALLDVLSRDEGIQEDDILFVDANGQGTAKRDICSLPAIEFQPFLLGIFHYLLMNRKDNTIGQQTFKQWYQKSPKGDWKYVGTLGKKLKNIPPVNWLEDIKILEPCYTQKEILARYATLTPEAVEELKTFPAIIANESTDYGRADESQLAICAAITDIRSQENGVILFLD